MPSRLLIGLFNCTFYHSDWKNVWCLATHIGYNVFTFRWMENEAYAGLLHEVFLSYDPEFVAQIGRLLESGHLAFSSLDVGRFYTVSFRQYDLLSPSPFRPRRHLEYPVGLPCNLAVARRPLWDSKPSRLCWAGAGSLWPVLGSRNPRAMDIPPFLLFSKLRQLGYIWKVWGGGRPGLQPAACFEHPTISAWLLGA